MYTWLKERCPNQTEANMRKDMMAGSPAVGQRNNRSGHYNFLDTQYKQKIGKQA